MYVREKETISHNVWPVLNVCAVDTLLCAAKTFHMFKLDIELIYIVFRSYFGFYFVAHDSLMAFASISQQKLNKKPQSFCMNLSHKQMTK